MWWCMLCKMKKSFQCLQTLSLACKRGSMEVSYQVIKLTWILLISLQRKVPERPQERLEMQQRSESQSGWFIGRQKCLVFTFFHNSHNNTLLGANVVCTILSLTFLSLYRLTRWVRMTSPREDFHIVKHVTFFLLRLVTCVSDRKWYPMGRDLLVRCTPIHVQWMAGPIYVIIKKLIEFLLETWHIIIILLQLTVLSLCY